MKQNEIKRNCDFELLFIYTNGFSILPCPPKTTVHLLQDICANRELRANQKEVISTKQYKQIDYTDTNMASPLSSCTAHWRIM